MSPLIVPHSVVFKRDPYNRKLTISKFKVMIEYAVRRISPLYVAHLKTDANAAKWTKTKE